MATKVFRKKIMVIHQSFYPIILVTHDPNVTEYATRDIVLKDTNIITDEKHTE